MTNQYSVPCKETKPLSAQEGVQSMAEKTPVAVKIETTTITRTVVAGKWVFITTEKGSRNA